MSLFWNDTNNEILWFKVTLLQNHLSNLIIYFHYILIDSQCRQLVSFLNKKYVLKLPEKQDTNVCILIQTYIKQ